MIGKAAGLKVVKANKTFREQAEMSRSIKSSKHQVIAADEKVMTIALKGKQSDHLDTMRYQRFQELMTTGKRPTTPTCYHQSVQQQSNTVSESSIRSNSGRGMLCRMDIGVGSFVEEDWKQRNFSRAPQSFLDIVICICTTGCRTLCRGCWDVRLLVLDAETFAKTCKITMTVAVKYWYDFAGLWQYISEVLWV